ncbi:TetR/AcrR family transcriptional regulator [Labrys sp. WJW]|uniref:TetR/AcrR family transcriptional regulator n=1 Tax=Labrys sp. WJW TaxID=1737983 RepID=UPI0009EF09CA|nr:TetR/AcrR family transcriptional regulator [Labrys sp. WJW]
MRSGKEVEQQGSAAHKAGYHHGDLRAALLAAAELVLAERGVEGFTLRECARRAGVSHAAPAHHFGDVAGLLTAVAALGFETLTLFMRQARAGIDEPEARLRAIGRGYVTFARQYPERFRLTFNRHRLNIADPALRAAGQEAFAELEIAIRLVTKAGDGPLEHDQLDVLLQTWSVVHGYAHLLLAGQLDGPLKGGGDAAADAALEGVLARLTAR